MAEVFHFEECLVKTLSGTVESRIDSYAENVTVALKKSFFDVPTEDGQVIKRYESGRSAELSIGKLFDTEIAHTDGNSIKFYYGNSLGTTTYQAGSCYIQDSGWSQSANDAVKYDVKISARTFGTV